MPVLRGLVVAALVCMSAVACSTGSGPLSGSPPVASGAAGTTAPQPRPPADAVPAGHPGSRPLALVYRGPAGCPGCSEPVARMLRTSPLGFRVRYVGPRERLKLMPTSFAGVSLYAQPGGDSSVRAAFRSLGARGRRAITRYVRSGGHYLGICQGAYLAGSDPGLGMLRPGNTVQYIATRRASTRSVRDTIIPIRWGGERVDMYFQDGPAILPSRVAGERVLARYSNGLVAALTRPYGAGRIGVVGPHPEAPRSWHREAGLAGRDRDGRDASLGHALIAATMAGAAPAP